MYVNRQTNPSVGFVVTFAVTGDGTGSFQTEFILSLSLTLNADNAAPEVPFELSFVC